MRRWLARVRVPLAAALVAPVAAPGQGSTVGGIVRIRNALPVGAVVYLIPDSVRSLHPEGEPLVIDQRNLHFVPHILAVVPGQAVAFRNSDPFLHNVFSPDTLGEAFDLGTYPRGEWRVHRFQRLGAHVILCHVHPEMEAYVVVVPTRHHDVADAEGRFELSNIRPGRYSLQVWHRRAEPFERSVTIAENTTLHLEIELERPGARPRK